MASNIKRRRTSTTTTNHKNTQFKNNCRHRSYLNPKISKKQSINMITNAKTAINVKPLVRSPTRIDMIIDTIAPININAFMKTTSFYLYIICLFKLFKIDSTIFGDGFRLGGLFPSLYNIYRHFTHPFLRDIS